MKKILCFLLGHRYHVIKEFSYETRCIGCKRCEKVWAMNDRVKALVPWDGSFAELHGFNPIRYRT